MALPEWLFLSASAVIGSSSYIRPNPAFVHVVPPSIEKNGIEKVFELGWVLLIAAEAKRLCNPTNGDKPLDPEIVWATIQALRLFKFGYSSGKVTSMYVVMWGNPPYYKQYLDYLNTPPPHWNLAEVKEWEKETGRIAYPEEPVTMVSVPQVPTHVIQQLEF